MFTFLNEGGQWKEGTKSGLHVVLVGYLFYATFFFLQLEQSGKNMEEIRDKIVEVEGMDINFDMLFDEYMCSLYRGKGCLIINIYVMRHNLSYLNFS